MLRCASVIAVFLFFLAATGARAAELTGFGPIKFGMTKDEAWAAIDGKGKWDRNGKWLIYEPVLHDRAGLVLQLDDLKFEVTQIFHDNLASDVFVVITATALFPQNCATEMHYFVAAIQHKYGKPTLVIDNVMDQAPSKNAPRSGSTSFRIFAFDNEALIRARLDTLEDEPLSWKCFLEVWYHPPVPNPIPF